MTDLSETLSLKSIMPGDYIHTSTLSHLLTSLSPLFQRQQHTDFHAIYMSPTSCRAESKSE